MIIGIIGAMPEEVNRIIEVLENKKTHVLSNREYYEGVLEGVHVVVAFSRWGKVAASTTAMQMISTFGVEKLMFTGVAGAISGNLHVGDLVVGRRFYQHDMDARPLFPRFEIPLSGVKFHESHIREVKSAFFAASAFLDEDSVETRHIFAMLGRKPQLLIGDIASGDQFIASSLARNSIRNNLPDVCCVEMEGAAVAQVCQECGIPFLVIRAISDSADEKADIDFPMFIREISSFYFLYITRNIIKTLACASTESIMATN